jgi:1-aminocyclopropane-1-carboxylate deaminase/D-cysteine desulfhydrase-like pyridoxal-dependent ACC family enzyme
MTELLLTRRFPGLAGLPRVPLVDVPTRVMRLEATSHRSGSVVYAKRDDETARLYGGNKVRKLEWLLGEARRVGATTIVTTGGYGSHHCLATAVYGARAGFDVHTVLFPQPMTTHVDEVLRAIVGAGATAVRVARAELVPIGLATTAARLKLGGKKTFVIGPGGSSARGCIGYVAAGIELAAQIDEGELEEPAAIFVAAGSGGTVAGLAVGLATAGVTTPIVAVRVTSKYVINRPRTRRLVRETVALLRGADPRFPDVAREATAAIHIDVDHLGASYGASTGEGERAGSLAAEDGLVLDPTYTAKAFAALLDAARDETYRGPLLFLSTLSSAPMARLLEAAPARPPFGG